MLPCPVPRGGGYVRLDRESRDRMLRVSVRVCVGPSGSRLDLCLRMYWAMRPCGSARVSVRRCSPSPLIRLADPAAALQMPFSRLQNQSRRLFRVVVARALGGESTLLDGG